MRMPVIKALVLVVDILSVVEMLQSLGIGGKIYDDGETANKVSGTELEREAASESKVPAVPFPAWKTWSIDFIHYLLLFAC